MKNIIKTSITIACAIVFFASCRNDNVEPVKTKIFTDSEKTEIVRSLVQAKCPAVNWAEASYTRAQPKPDTAYWDGEQLNALKNLKDSEWVFSPMTEPPFPTSPIYKGSGTWDILLKGTDVKKEMNSEVLLFFSYTYRDRTWAPIVKVVRVDGLDTRLSWEVTFTMPMKPY